MKSNKRFTLALTAALMTTTITVSPALAQPEAPSLAEQTTASPEESPAEKTTPVEKDAEKNTEVTKKTEEATTVTTKDEETTATSTSTQKPSTPSSTSTKKKANAKVKIKADKTESKMGGGKTEFSINVSYDGLKADTEYQAQFTIKDKSGKVIADRQPEKFEAKGPNGERIFKLSFDGSIGTATVSLDIVDRKDGIVASTDKDTEVVAKGENVDPSISTTASLDTDVIQTGSKVSDIVAYEGFVPGKKYTIETTLMCKADEKSTGAEKTSEFTPEESKGKFKVDDIEVKDADCLEQVVFEVIKDEDGIVVAEHKDIDDKAQTVGGDRDGKKKKKKKDSVPVATEVKVPVRKAPQAVADAKANATPPGDRATIGSVPSGEFSNYGATIFER